MRFYDPLVVSNNFIEKGFNDKIVLNPIELQILLYFTYRDYLKITGKALFSERFEAGKIPEISKIYRYFKKNNISKYYRDFEGAPTKADTNHNKYLRYTINSIWDKYRTYNDKEMIKIVNKKDSAISKAIQNNSVFLSDADIIKEED